LKRRVFGDSTVIKRRRWGAAEKKERTKIHQEETSKQRKKGRAATKLLTENAQNGERKAACKRVRVKHERS